MMQITFNGGALWSELQKPVTYNYAECDRCRGIPDAKCKLHLHGPTGWVEGPGIHYVTAAAHAAATASLLVPLPAAAAAAAAADDDDDDDAVMQLLCRQQPWPWAVILRACILGMIVNRATVANASAHAADHVA